MNVRELERERERESGGTGESEKMVASIILLVFVCDFIYLCYI